MAKNGIFLFLGNRRHGDADAGIGATKHHRQAITIGPLAKFLGAKIRLVLVIGGQKLDLVAKNAAAEILDRHLGGFYAPLARSRPHRGPTCHRCHQ